MIDFHIKLKSEAQTVYTFFLVYIYGVRHILFFSATTNKKQVTMDYLWGEGPGGAMNYFLFYAFLYSWNFLILHIYYFLLKMSQGVATLWAI